MVQAVREAHPAQVPVTDLIDLWNEPVQARRCLDSLAQDGLVRVLDGMVTLPQ